jgi:uncharacterized membrane protein YphA (DoxX/SURF4 family)
MDEFVATAIRVVVGGLLLVAGLMKVRHGLHRFTLAVLSYEIVRGRVAHALARGIAYAEIVLGIVLLTGIFTRSAAVAAAVLVAAFTIAIGFSLARRRPHSCGCGGPLEAPMGPRLIARNALLLGALALLAVRSGV